MHEQLIKATPANIAKVQVQTAQTEQRSDRSRSPPRRIVAFLRNPVQIADRTYTSADLTYAYWRRLSEDFTPQKDFLKQLYPHTRDNDCIMVEQTHTYFVHDVPYHYSVSGVWKVFFDDVDSPKTALLVLERAKDRGLQNILSSVYNLYIFFVMLKHLNPRSSQFWDALETTLLLAKDYNLQEYEANAARTAMHALLEQGTHKKKPAGPSCYFLALCARCTTDDIQNVWKQNGELEALKGTLLHKRIELYIQALAKWQCESRHTRVRLS